MGNRNPYSLARRAMNLWAIVSLLAAMERPRAIADETPALRSDEVAAGFTPLFNGKDLTGWHEVQGLPGTFVIENGELVGRRNKYGAGAYWLSTDEKYADFELRLEYQLPAGGNSGVFIRVPSPKGRSSVVGMEIQLLDDGDKPGEPTAGNTGSIYRVVAPRGFLSKPANEWNEIQIACDGDRVQVTLNGVLINNASMDDFPALKSRPREGFIGLSAHDHMTSVRFRNVRIRRLNAPAASASAARS